MVLLPSRLGAPHGFILRCWLRDLQLTWDLLVESQLSCLAILQSFHVLLGGYNHPLSISFVHEWQEKMKPNRDLGQIPFIACSSHSRLSLKIIKKEKTPKKWTAEWFWCFKRREKKVGPFLPRSWARAIFVGQPAPLKPPLRFDDVVLKQLHDLLAKMKFHDAPVGRRVT